MPNPKRWCCESAAFNRPANLENSAVATGLERSVFIPISKNGNTKECSYYRTIALISHASEVMLKILQNRLQQYVNWELSDVQAGFRKAEEPEIKLPTSIGSQKKQENSRKTSTSVSLTTLQPLTVWNKLWRIFNKMGIPDPFSASCETCMQVKNQPDRTGHGTTNGFNWERSTSKLYTVTLLI